MNQSSQNTNPTKPEPSGSGTPDFMLGEPTGQVGEAAEPVGASTGSAGAATEQPCQTDETSPSTATCMYPNSHRPGMTPTPRASSRPKAGRTRTATVSRAGSGSCSSCSSPW